MFAYFVRRGVQSIFVLLLASILIFLVTRFFGDPVDMMLPLGYSQEMYDQLKHEIGLDAPLVVQYFRWLADAVRGDFGISYWQDAPALPLVLERFPATVLLALLAIGVATVIAVPLGVLASLKPGSFVDRICSMLALLGVSLPDFWLGLMLILILSAHLGWFPTSGFGGPVNLVLPVLTLAARPAGRIAQMVRSNMFEELQKQYVIVGRAKGLSELRVIALHVTKNAAIGMITLAGLEYTRLFAGGAVVVETVFAYPGIGQLIILGVERRDFMLLQANVMVVVLTVLFINFAIDILYGSVNPRTRFV